MKSITPAAVPPKLDKPWSTGIRGDAGSAGRSSHKSAHTNSKPPGHNVPGAKPPGGGSTT